ncbi:BamA/TamA family outer membrane protein [Bernardetia sp.]|uniref:BamA/TamA family outer membrane protein n=1 Tax=Bernardetia sp. TaxID=1937974 RepID=UPI0025BAD50C|nr:BamA/TamA family outer membrane protein [Bernardetia sp.]
MKQFFTLLSFVCFFSITHTTTGQSFIKRYIANLINDTTDASKPRFIAYPTLAYSPETNLEIGLSSLYIYYAKRDTTNRLSELSAFTFFTLENQYGIWLENAIYTHQDKVFILGKIRLQSFPLLYYGIGSNTPEEHQAIVDANQIWVRQRVLRKVKKNFFIGPEFDFTRLSKVDFMENEEFEPIDLPLGHEGSTNFGIGAGIVYDNRHNVLNVRDGFFSELGFLHYNDGLNNFEFNSIVSDTRLFRPVGQHNVWATQILGQFNLGNVPFNQLALLGGETMMRGYYTGRFRDKNQIAAQTEFRFLPLPLGFSKRIGATLFGSVATVFPNTREIDMKNLVWAGGAGLRFLLFPKKDIYTRIDYSFTREGRGFYILIGEAF